MADNNTRRSRVLEIPETTPIDDITACAAGVLFNIFDTPELAALVKKSWIDKIPEGNVGLSVMVGQITCGHYWSAQRWAENFIHPDETFVIQRIWGYYIADFRRNGKDRKLPRPVSGLSAVSRFLGVDSALDAFFAGVPEEDILI